MAPHDRQPAGADRSGDVSHPCAGVTQDSDLAWIDGFEQELRDRLEQAPVPERRPTLLDRLFARKRE